MIFGKLAFIYVCIRLSSLKTVGDLKSCRGQRTSERQRKVTEQLFHKLPKNIINVIKNVRIPTTFNV